MTIIRKPLSELHKPDKNVRRHTEKQIHEYIRSLEMFGQIKPVVIDDTGEIIVGNGLYEALLAMGADSCDCYVVTGLSSKQKKKLMLADNRVYELGITDTDVFDELIRELDGDVDVPGWDADLLEMLNASVDDANDMIESYGVYEPEDVETVVRRERSTVVEPAHHEQSNTGAALAAPVGAFVICPKCGEHICL
ncbi:MAG TPA: ParB N-terminal domain-containing protein [Candidatus Scatomorpha merdigallinarum]|nr:ParB N-terminal domain-containing protein [Candidatus Scatomorpha merdigallinarum]